MFWNHESFWYFQIQHRELLISSCPTFVAPFSHDKTWFLTTSGVNSFVLYCNSHKVVWELWCQYHKEQQTYQVKPKFLYNSFSPLDCIPLGTCSQFCVQLVRMSLSFRRGLLSTGCRVGFICFFLSKLGDWALVY